MKQYDCPHALYNSVVCRRSLYGIYICDRFNVLFRIFFLKYHCLLLCLGSLCYFHSFVLVPTLNLLCSRAFATIFVTHNLRHIFGHIFSTTYAHFVKSEKIFVISVAWFSLMFSLHNANNVQFEQCSVEEKKNKWLKACMDGNKRKKMYEANVSDFLIMHCISMEWSVMLSRFLPFWKVFSRHSLFLHIYLHFHWYFHIFFFLILYPFLSHTLLYFICGIFTNFRCNQNMSISITLFPHFSIFSISFFNFFSILFF